MKESGHAALGMIRSKAKEFGIDEDCFFNLDIHVHFPAGGIPKDGPSAGITMATALISRLTNTPIRKDVAMTGEITLTGKVLPIGGLKEKSLAARRHGIKTIIVPEKNRKDVDDIPAEYREGLEFVCVKTIEEVLKIALVSEESATKTTKSQRKKSHSDAEAA